MKNKVQSYRLRKNMTQTQLAEKAGLSLRTIQRIEAGTVPKGFTLQALAVVFDVGTEKLITLNENYIELNRIKIINLSALAFLILPFGNIILPSILTYKSEHEIVKSFGKEIISFQIIWTIMTSILLIISPFLQNLFLLKTPLFIFVVVFSMCINVFIIIKNGINLTRNSKLYIKLKINIL